MASIYYLKILESMASIYYWKILVSGKFKKINIILKKINKDDSPLQRYRRKSILT